MLVTHTIDIDLANPGAIPRIQVKQGDCMSRLVEVRLFANGKAWAIPSGTTPIIRYHIHDLDTAETGSGIYQTLADGSAACQFTGNVLQMLPIPEMLARHSIVSTDIAFVQEGKVLCTCTFEFYVNRAPGEGTTPTGLNYYRLSSLEQVNAEFDKVYAAMEGTVGAPGISPVVTVTAIGGGNRITITDAQGTKSFDVLDGATGPQGLRGPYGDDGMSAYEYAVLGGFAGTESEFAYKLAALMNS